MSSSDNKDKNIQMPDVSDIDWLTDSCAYALPYDPETISILVPTRGRPKSFEDMVKTVYLTANEPQSVEVLGYLDYDDPELEQYKEICESYHKPELPVRFARVMTGSSEGVGKAWNTLASIACGSLLMMGNDDLRWQTQGWDAHVRNAARGASTEIFVIHCNDTIQHAKHAAFPIVHKKWVDTLGYFVPELFGFGYHDTWISEIANILDCFIYLEDTIIKHHHYSKPGGIRDNTSRRNMHHWGRDKKIFGETRDIREKDAKKLQAINHSE